jgi:thiol-disulfide isomerase/thioredoxin
MFTDSDKPKTLTESEIMELQKKHGIVLFYMDGCGHCEAMKPAWNKVIDELKEKHKDEIILGAIESGDMDMFKKSGISPSVSGFPTILYFHPNNISKNDMYNGDRSYEDLKKWILDKKDNKRTSDIVMVKNYKPDVNKMKKGIKGINSMEKNELSQSGGARKSRRSRGRKIRKYTMKKSRKYRKSHNRKHTKRQHRK